MKIFQSKNTIQMGIIFLLLLTVLSGCSTVSGPTPTAIVKPHTQTLTITPKAETTLTATNSPKVITATIENSSLPTEVPTVTPEIFPPEGDIIFSCQEGIAKYSLGTNEIIPLVGFQEVLFPEFGLLNWDTEKMYFTRASSTFSVPNAGGFGLGPFEIFSMNPDGSDLVQLTSDGVEKGAVTSSPNNDYLAFEAYGSDNDKDFWHKLVIYQKESKIEKVILEWQDDINIVSSYFFWSPNGDQLATLVSPNLYLYDLELGEISQLIPEKDVADSKISWSPDQKYIAAGVYDDEKKKSDIYLINSESGKIDRTIFVEQNAPHELTWSSDGKRMVYSYYFGTGEYDRYSQLWSVNISDEKFSLLHTGNNIESRKNYCAFWIPNSEYIAYFTRTVNSNVIIIQNTNTLDYYVNQELPEDMYCTQILNSVWIDSP